MMGRDFYREAILSGIVISMSFGLTEAQYHETNFVRYTVHEGLSDNYVTSIAQDTRGYIWIGTDAGLNRYDGYTFKTFGKSIGNFSLPSEVIYNLRATASDQLFIISREGIQLLSSGDYSIVNFRVPDNTPISIYQNMAWDAALLPDQSVAMTSGSGFYVFDREGALTYRYDAYQPDDLGQTRIFYGREIFPLDDTMYIVFTEQYKAAIFNPGNNTYRLIPEKEGLWEVFFPGVTVKTTGYITRQQISRHEFIIINFENNHAVYYNHSSGKVVVSIPDLPENEFNWDSRITMLNDSTFAVNSANSGFFLFHLDRQLGRIKYLPQRFLSSYKLQRLYLDQEKRLWAGTTKGLLRQKLAVPIVKSYSFQPQVSDIVTGGFTCAYRYHDKLLLGRFSSNKGLTIADAYTYAVEQQIDLYGSNSDWNQIRTIQMYHPDTLWIGTSAGLLWFDMKTQHYGKVHGNTGGELLQISVLMPPTSSGHAWMCGWLNGVLARYDTNSRTFKYFTASSKSPIPFQKVKNIAYDSFGDVWISGDGLSRWNSKEQAFDTLITKYGSQNRNEINILTMVADERGSLWFHTESNGLSEYRISEGKFFNYTVEDGLPSNILYALSPVVDGQIWIAGSTHVTAFDIVSKKARIFDHSDGLPEDKPSSRYLFHDASQKKLYALHKHTLAVIPLNIPSLANYCGGLIIEEFSVNHDRIINFPLGRLPLKSAENNISASFSVLDYEFGSSYLFAFRLNSADSWTSLGTQRQLHLSSLSPGSYAIELKALGKFGNPLTAIMQFSIATPLWIRPWFLAAAMVLVASGFYLLHRHRINRIHEKANLEKQLGQSEMKALHAQMNPHFVFNSLNSIEEMIMNNENNAASHFLGKFAYLIRMTLNQSEQSFVSLRTTLDYLRRYIEMEQIRNNRFTCNVVADTGLPLDETFLPPMLIQPFIENAIWHGRTDRQKTIDIRVDFKKDKGDLLCVVDDNGTGIEESLKNKNKSGLYKSMGISNIEHRINLLNEIYGLKGRLTITDKRRIAGSNGTGTIVTLRLPLEPIQDE